MANEDSTWPSPSGRWRSFEAEPFPVTAYRYDSRLPTVIGNDGFVGYNRDLEIPVFSMFSYDTVFSSGSKKGGESFLEDDLTVFDSFKSDLFSTAKKAKVFRVLRMDKRIRLNNLKENFKKIKFPHAYKIKTNSHNTIPFRDFSELFDKKFDVFVTNIGLNDFDTGEPAFKKSVSDSGNFIERFKNSASQEQIDSSHNYIKIGFAYNDEIHIKGPVRARTINRAAADRPLTCLGRDIKHEGASWLDLATAL